jgi:hypothetical protein
MMNKLRFDGYWHNRPRDLANLSKVAGRALERPLNWQVVSTAVDWTDWTDSPILYLASHAAPKLTDDEINKIRAFVQAGGLLFTHADAGAGRFNDFAGQLAKKMFPDYELANLPQDHPLYSVQYPMKTRPQLKAVSNGARLLMVHSPQDLTTAWQVRDQTPPKRPNWELGSNLFVYAAGKSDFRNRLDSPNVADAPAFVKPIQSVTIGRLKYTGNWDPEPYAMTRFSKVLRLETNWSLTTEALDFNQLKSTSLPLVHLSGTAAQSFSATDLAAIKQYVDAGGTLLIDDCGGAGAFTGSLEPALTAAFGTKFEPVAFNDKPFTPAYPGMDDLTKPRLRPYTESRLGPAAAKLLLLESGKGRVILSPLDLTSGLLGTNTWGVNGFHPTYAQALMKNLVIWTRNRTVPH